MLDLAAYRAHRWAAWHVFVYAFAVALLGIVALVYGGSLDGLRPEVAFWAALLASVAVAGTGYQEVRKADSPGATRWADD